MVLSFWIMKINEDGFTIICFYFQVLSDVMFGYQTLQGNVCVFKSCFHSYFSCGTISVGSHNLKKGECWVKFKVRVLF